MIKTDVYISGSTLAWMVFCILIVGYPATYHLGYRHGQQDERQGWIEDVILGKNVPITQTTKPSLKKGE